MGKLKGRLPQFVPIFMETMNCPAWKALSFGARALYIAIKARKPQKKNCAYLSYRNALKDLGRRNHRKIAEWFSELQHYGFIVLEKHGSLGVDGKGKAPLWRITEVPNEITGEWATKEYLKWDGVLYEPKFRVRCPYPRSKKRTPVVKTSMRATGSTPKASHMCTTGSTPPDPTVHNGEYTTVHHGECTPCTTGSTGFYFSETGGAVGGEELELANRLLGSFLGI